MTKYIQNSVLALFMCLTSSLAFAIDSQELPDVKEGIVDIKITDPDKLVGYTVGDVIEREVVLTIKAPYKLIDTSLPIPGYEKRYRGQLIGIELKSISHEKDESKDESTHRIKLAYQVFTNNVVAKNAALGPEYLNLINTKDSKDLVKYRIPLLSIAVSPIAIFGAVKVENNMSTFLGPLLMPKHKEQQALKISLITLALGLLGLLYIMGKHAWLPRMGGAFDKAHRQVRKTANTAEGLQQAVSITHQAINASAGMSVFNDNSAAFLHAHPKFNPMRGELETFFGLSRQVYFEPKFQMQNAFGAAQNPHQWLVQFTRRCRDCERGLTPEPIKMGA
jgi:mxaA protein